MIRPINTRIWTLFASLACIVALAAHAETPSVPILPPTEKTLSPVSYKDEAGEIKTLETTGRTLTAVHFWATWCVPCVKELPEVDAVAAAYSAKGFTVIAISLDNSLDKVKTFYADMRITHLPANLDNSNTAFRASKLRGLPGTLFFNRSGEVIGRADGPLDWKDAATTSFIESHLP